MEDVAGLRVRWHGAAGPLVIVLHGGPAACGSAVGLARALADGFRVLEPWQRGSGDRPLTVARHVADLDELVTAVAAGVRPALVGESWGAMLALAYAAEHPDRAGPLVLVGCGTFDPVARAKLRATVDERTSPELRETLARLAEDDRDPDARLKAFGELLGPLYHVDPVDEDDPEAPASFDERAHRETWEDMLRQQEAGVYPAGFAAIRSPVLMLHGGYDPHPGALIRDGLKASLPQLEYREWAQAGHSPWRERAVRGEFSQVLRDWLASRLAGDDG